LISIAHLLARLKIVWAGHPVAEAAR
jgi:hypothetical protein